MNRQKQKTAAHFHISLTLTIGTRFAFLTRMHGAVKDTQAVQGHAFPDATSESSKIATAGKMPQSDRSDAVAPLHEQTVNETRKLDFGFLPIPESRRYRPDRSFSPFLNYLFAFVRAVSRILLSSKGNSWFCTFPL